MNTATQLLEQAMEELIQGRDGFITAMQIDSREETIKDIEAYLRSNVAKQQVEKEPVAWLYFDKNRGLTGYLRVCELLPREQGSFPVYVSNN